MEVLEIRDLGVLVDTRRSTQTKETNRIGTVLPEENKCSRELHLVGFSSHYREGLG